jgi:hypothetical protein
MKFPSYLLAGKLSSGENRFVRSLHFAESASDVKFSPLLLSIMAGAQRCSGLQRIASSSFSVSDRFRPTVKEGKIVR